MALASESRSSYDRLARWYDLIAGPSEGRYRAAALTLLAPAPGEVILEIGSGTGHALVALARSVGAAGLACGVDLSAGMCRVAARRLRQARRVPAASLVRGDAARLPWRDHVFDAIFMSFTLELFPAARMAVVLGECRRVLRENGRLGLAVLAEPAQPGLMTRLYGWAHRRYPTVVDCRPIPVEAVLDAHGFAVAQAERGSLWGLPVAIVAAVATA